MRAPIKALRHLPARPFEPAREDSLPNDPEKSKHGYEKWLSSKGHSVRLNFFFILRRETAPNPSHNSNPGLKVRFSSVRASVVRLAKSE